MGESLTYQQAIAELEDILDGLEGEDVDVDVLSSKVRRAFELITFCRERIEATEIEISQIVGEVPAVSAGDDDAAEDG